MRYIEDKLESLDNYFVNKTSSEKWLIILILAGMIGYILYLYLFPYAEDRYNSSKLTQKQLQQKIAEEETYLHSITVNGDRNYYIKKFDREIAQKQKTIEDYQQRIALLDRNFQKLSEVLFNRHNWAIFLDSITSRAHANDVSILELQNHYVNDNKSFGHVLETGIKCKGKFQSIIAFINDLEQNKLVTDVYHTDIRLDPKRKTIVADLNVSVWGVNR
ncbi:type 4a pilus biogenesis protein PilO [Nitratifractor sp.]|uniref:type 4a pilus biogenesis protein PilO n=1 Tax=Nitratifractor sp. TaxID=2268144 RepID=UPI0025F77CAC|nr:type 4a pilus biogenesis protein PilO [Nitratifractor sp.]